MNTVEPFLKKDFLLYEKEIGKIDGCPCPSNTTLAYDLNLIKIKFCSMWGVPQMASVNAVIFTKNKKILLIEFKKSDPDRLLAIRLQYFIQSFKVELPHKIKGSEELLKMSCKHYGISPKPLPINCIYLVNLSNQDYMVYMANTAPERGITFTKSINHYSAILNCKWFEEYLKKT